MSCLPVAIAERVLGNIFVRPVVLERAGDVTRGHSHRFDHVTIVVRGGVRVRATLPDGTGLDRGFAPGDYCLIRAGVEHEITATADDTYYLCVYSHRTPQGEVTEEWTGFEEATL